MKLESTQMIDSNLQVVFDHRAQQFAKQHKKPNQQEIHPYIMFELQNESFGISLKDCQRILSHQKITPVPFTTSFVKGVLHYRGNLLPTIDLLQFFGYSTTPTFLDQHIIVIEDQRTSVCLMVDKIRGLNRYSEKELGEPLSEDCSENKKYIQGIHHGNISIINTKIIIDELLAIHPSIEKKSGD